MFTHRIVMSFGAGMLRNDTEIFVGSQEECEIEFCYLPTAEELEADGKRNAYEGTQPFQERCWIEKIEPGDDPRWPG